MVWIKSDRSGLVLINLTTIQITFDDTLLENPQFTDLLEICEKSILR